MNISKNLALNIVHSLKDVLNQEINFIDTSGTIIASTDKNRVGTTHEGAKIVIRTQKELFISQDNQYPGSKKGINVPVYFDSKIIGVIGLTGEKEVRKYVEILKKMTEILIKEAYIKDFKFQLREHNRLTIDSLLLSSDSLSQENLLEFDFSSPYQVIFSSLAINQQINSEKTNLIMQLFENNFLHYPQIIFTVNKQFAVIIVNKIVKKELLRLLNQIINEAFTNYNILLNFGIGHQSCSHEELKNSFKQAKQASQWLDYQNITRQIVYFEDLNLGVILASILEESKLFFIERILGNLQEEELTLFRETFRAFSKNNGCIQKCADELFIHKNTLQYRLNKIKALTGFTPRNYNDFAVLKIAFLLDSEREKRKDCR